MLSETPAEATSLVLLVRVSGQTLAMRQREIAEILPVPRLAALPEAPPIVLGAFHLGGVPVLVLRMASLLGLQHPAEGDPLYHHLLLLPEKPGHPRLALLIDRATDIVTAEPTVMAPDESFNGCVEGDVVLGGVLVPLVTAERLLTAHEAARLSAYTARALARNNAFAAPGLA